MIGQGRDILVDALGTLRQGAQCDSGPLGYWAVAVLGAIENARHRPLYIIGAGRREMWVWTGRTGEVLGIGVMGTR